MAIVCPEWILFLYYFFLKEFSHDLFMGVFLIFSYIFSYTFRLAILAFF